MPKINLKRVFEILFNSVKSDKEYYEILFKKQKQVKFCFKRFDVVATISMEKKAVKVKTESLFNVPMDHPASYVIERELEGRDFYTQLCPAEGLVLFLEFTIDKRGRVIANGRTLGPYFQELIPEMRGAIDAIRAIVIEKFPYLAGQNAVRVGDETIIIAAEQNQKTIRTLLSTVITKPTKHKYTSEFNEFLFGSTISHDDDRLLPNFFFHNKQLYFFTPKKKLIEKRGNITKYEYIGTERLKLTPFFKFIGDLSGRIQEFPVERNSLCHIILRNIGRILDDIALIGTPDGETILISLNSDIKDRHRYASEHNIASGITERDVKEIAKWRELIGSAIGFGKYQERMIKARFAARSIGNVPKILGVEKRKVNRVGSGFSVYISPIEAQICNLGKEASIELVEKGDEKYLIVKRLPK